MASDPRQVHNAEDVDSMAPRAISPSMAAVTQQHKTRRRRGSLRKAALLGRGAQRERKENKSSALTTPDINAFDLDAPNMAPMNGQERDALGLKVFNVAPTAPQTGGVAQAYSTTSDPMIANAVRSLSRSEARADRRKSYNSTTDEDEIMQMPRGLRSPSSNMPAFSGSESYFPERAIAPNRRSFQQAKSPLSYGGIATTALPPPDSNWDYSETEWWGWVVLTVTWFIFVIGMGSCLNIWSWAWDVGTTPYAPPELEDDPTLPIVGYYPALIILTGVMAWVWVVVAWVGMKYFRHAKISGD